MGFGFDNNTKPSFSINSFLNKKKEESLTEEIFKEIYRKDFQGILRIKITMKAENNKVEEIAKKLNITVDILKLFYDSIIIPAKKRFEFSLKLSS